MNALCPGPVNTPLLQELFAKDPEQAARRLVHLPMGRFAEAREIANGALFLASDESSYVTAQAFMVDGGISSAYVTPGVTGARAASATKRSATPRPSSFHASEPRHGLAPQRLGVEPDAHGVLVALVGRRATCSRPARVTSAWNWMPQTRAPGRR